MGTANALQRLRIADLSVPSLFAYKEQFIKYAISLNIFCVYLRPIKPTETCSLSRNVCTKFSWHASLITAGEKLDQSEYDNGKRTAVLVIKIYSYMRFIIILTVNAITLRW